MPILEYECPKCGHTWEVLVMGTEKRPTKCPKCGADKIEQLLSVPAKPIVK